MYCAGACDKLEQLALIGVFKPLDPGESVWEVRTKHRTMASLPRADGPRDLVDQRHGSTLAVRSFGQTSQQSISTRRKHLARAALSESF
jgi:hypothetical protein